MREFRGLVGGTRISDGEVLAILRNPKITVSEETLEAMAETLGQDTLDRPVWIPRRLVRHLAAHGSRLEIASALVLAIRRMVNRFGRARVSARMIADVAKAGEKHVVKALQSLQSKRLIIKNKQAERWSVNRWGSLYDFPADLGIDPFEDQKPVRALPRRRSSKGFSPARYGEVLQLLTQKGGDLINRDPSSLLEQQRSLSDRLQMAPPNPEFELERRRLSLLAGKYRLDRQGPSPLHALDVYQRYRSQCPPLIPRQAPWRKAA